ncbi:MAG TPA: PAS domain-containing sensor histidine kinase [Bacteroidales bacterium]
MNDEAKSKAQLITEIKQIRLQYDRLQRFEQALLESESRYKSLYTLIRLLSDNMSDMLWSKDLENRYLFANKAMCDKLLIASDIQEPIGKTDLFFAEREREKHPERKDWHTFGEICADSDIEIRKSLKPGRFDEYGNVKGEFLFLDVLKAPLIDEKGNMIGVVGSARDVTKEKLIAQELNASEERYKTLISNLPNYVIVHVNGKIVFINNLSIITLGYPLEEIINSSILDYVDKPYRKLAADNLRKRIKGEDIPDYELKICTRSGRKIDVLLRGATIIYQHEQAFIVVLTDITERKKAEDALRLSEEKYRQLSELSIDVIWQTDLNLKYTYVSPAIEKIRGFTPGEYMQLPPEKIYSAESLRKVRKIYKELLNEALNGTFGDLDRAVVLDLEYYHKDGSLQQGEIRARFIWNEEGKPIGVQGITRDVTDRKITEKALKESENTYRELFNFMSDAAYILDENGIFLDVNQGAVNMYGYSREELIGQTPEMLSADGRNDMGKTLAYIREAFAGKSQNFDWWGKRKNGEIFPKDVVVNKGSYFGKDAVVAIARDITERKNIEEQLKAYANELKDLNATKDKFFSIIAHDLKGPFNAILGFSDLLAESYDDFSEEEKMNFIQNIKIASDSTYKLLENLLDWSRLQTGKINPTPEMIDLSLLTLENISVLKSMADNKRIKLYSSIQYNTRAFADANMVRTILRNLMSNAIKFTRPGGEVNISSTEDNAMVQICVWDNGIGISAARLGMLFRIDEKLSTKGTANETGTGLGLLLCKEMIERQGGHLWVESETGQGSRFYFTLPVEPA